MCKVNPVKRSVTTWQQAVGAPRLFSCYLPTVSFTICCPSNVMTKYPWGHGRRRGRGHGWCGMPAATPSTCSTCDQNANHSGPDSQDPVLEDESTPLSSLLQEKFLTTVCQELQEARQQLPPRSSSHPKLAPLATGLVPASTSPVQGTTHTSPCEHVALPCTNTIRTFCVVYIYARVWWHPLCMPANSVDVTELPNARNAGVVYTDRLV